MTTIQEIMACVYRSQFAASAYEASSGPGTKELEVAMFAADGEVQALITQAIAEARADGAREMREAAAQVAVCDWPEWADAATIRATIRALPLPANPEPVRLTDEAVADACRDIAIAVAKNCGSVPQLTHPHIYLGVRKLLTANGLTK